MNDLIEPLKGPGLDWTGERYVPELAGQIALEHVHRYLFARQICRGKDVLDIASGEGYGSDILAGQAASVVGVDISEDAVAHGTRRYGRPNLRFLQGECAAIPLPSASVDVVVSFETIEHHDQHHAMMSEIKRVLRPGGVLVLSSPDKYEYAAAVGEANPYHVKELSRLELTSLLDQHFAHHLLYGQKILYGSVLCREEGATRFVGYNYQDKTCLGHSGLVKPVYLVAIASDATLPEADSSLLEQNFLESDFALAGIKLVNEQREQLEQLRSREKIFNEQREQLEQLREREKRWITRARLMDCKLSDDMSAQAEVASHMTKGWFGNLLVKHTRDFRLLADSVLFSPVHYLSNCPGARQSQMDPLAHYLKHGVRKSGGPHPLFDGAWYLACNPDVAARKLNPLVHYLRHGAREGRSPHPLFDVNLYQDLYPEASHGHADPLVHYLQVGARAGYRPHWLFDAKTYLERNPEILKAGLNPVQHYLQVGWLLGYPAHWAFDEDYYLSSNPDVLELRLPPLLHYLVKGYREGRWPNPDFDPAAYLKRNPELQRTGENPLIHYVRGCDHPRLPGRAPAASVPGTPAGTAMAGPAVPAEKPSGRSAQSRVSEPTAALIKLFEAEWGESESALLMNRMRNYRLPFSSDANITPPTDADIAAMLMEIEAHPVPSGTHDRPDVSIIIPVYNQLAYTLACICSVLASPSRYSYEILIGDDASTDATGQIFAQRRGCVRRIGTGANQGFIRNCNQAAREARGRYLVFLNNDTFVLPGWLDELIGTLESDDSIGLAGSRLIYPDGRLQEAGGILWQDLSAWNYGRYENPRRPEYAYRRDVDYISGASIALSRQDWETLGGFDEWYDVAYGEDSDLALRVRRDGKRVVYQPLSMLLHFEGISSGTDTSKGVKAYQVSNARKLRERWASTVAGHRPNGHEPLLEKERVVRGRVLVIDHCTPTPDQDAGSLTCLEIMKAFQGNGFKVTFIPEDNFLYMPKETRDLQRIGIEAVYYPFYRSVRDYLKDYGSLFDVVLIFRSGAAGRHLDTVRKTCPQARVVFHTSDLHYIREMRQAELDGDQEKLRKAERTRKLELGLIESVDLTIVHSTFEQEVLHQESPGSAVYVFPWILDPVGCRTPFDQRQGLLFLGGYRHLPNVDAVLYFAREVWPRVRAAIPDITFHVVGSHPPPEVQKLDGKDGIIVTGFVEHLEPYFEKARMSIAPIRYGAGIKGKVAMSMAHGVPVVATGCAAEGMGLSHGQDVLIADDPQAMAEAVITLHRDQALWRTLSGNSLDFVERNYGSRLGLARIREILAQSGYVPRTGPVSGVDPTTSMSTTKAKK